MMEHHLFSCHLSNLTEACVEKLLIKIAICHKQILCVNTANQHINSFAFDSSDDQS